MRHNNLQVFVVARVGKHYRTLATVLVHFRSDLYAVETCLHLLQIYSSPENRACLKQELRLAGVDVAPRWGRPSPLPSPAQHQRRKLRQQEEQHDSDRVKSQSQSQRWLNQPFFPSGGRDDIDDGGTSPIRPSSKELFDQYNGPCPFPFITTCLLIGTMLLPGYGAIGAVSEQPYGIAFDQTRNEGTLAVLDITDLSVCSYGFVYVPWLEDDEDNAELGQPRNTVLSATEYIDAQAQVTGYYPHELGQSRERVNDVLDKVGQFGILSADCLPSLWPFYENWVHDSRQDFGSQQTTSSLKAVAFGRVVDAFLSSSLDITLLDEISKLPDFHYCLRACLESRADAVAANPTATIQILQLAFAGQKHVDLSPYFGLTINMVTAILQIPDISTMMDTLSLAAGTMATSEEFIQLAGALPSTGITHFFLMELPRRHGDTFDPSEVYWIMKPKVRDKLILGPVLSHGVRQIPWLHNFSGSAGCPTTSSAQGQDNGALNTNLVCSDQGHVTQLLFQCLEETDMEERVTEIVHLGDAILSPMRLVAGLIKLLGYRLRQQPQRSCCLLSALCFASAPGHLRYSDTAEVISLPTETYTQSQQGRPELGATSWTKLSQLKSHEWTLVVDRIDGRDSFLADESFFREAADLALAFPELRDKASIPRTRTFRVVFIRPRTSVDLIDMSTFSSSSWAIPSPDLFETLSLDAYLQRYAAQDFHREDLEAASQHLQKKRDMSSHVYSVGQAGGGNISPAVFAQNSRLDRPVLTVMSATRACEILREAVVQDEVADAKYAARATKSTCTKHRECTCQGRMFRV